MSCYITDTSINYIIEQKAKENKVSFSIFPLLIFSLYAVSGYNGAAHNYILFGLFLIWVFFISIQNINAFVYVITLRQNIFFLLFLMYYFLTSIFVADLQYTLSYIGMYLIHYTTIIYYAYYMKEHKYSNLRILCMVSLTVWFFFCIRALVFYFQNPGAARLLAADFNAFNNIAIGGGYGLAYGSALLCIFLFDALLSRDIQYKKLRFLAIIGVIILILVVFLTESSLTIMALLVGFIISIIKHLYYGKETLKRRNLKRKIRINKRKVIIISMLMVLFMGLAANINTVGDYIVQSTSEHVDNVFYRRINRIGEKFSYIGTGIQVDNYIDERASTLKESWDMFLVSPVIGNGYKFGNIYSDGTKYGIGGHSEWLDALANHGLFGGIPFLLMYYYAIKSDKRRRYSTYYTYIPVMFLLGLNNPFQTYQSCFSLFFLIPTLSWYLKYKRSDLLGLPQTDKG